MFIFKIIIVKKTTIYKKLFTKNIFTKSYILKYWVLKKTCIHICSKLLKKSVCKCIISKSLFPHVLLCFSILRSNTVCQAILFSYGTSMDGADCLCSDFQLHDGGTPKTTDVMLAVCLHLPFSFSTLLKKMKG